MAREAYTGVGWKDYPDTATPITANNLNKADNGIKTIDAFIGFKDISALGGTLTDAVVKLNDIKVNKTDITMSKMTLDKDKKILYITF